MPFLSLSPEILRLKSLKKIHIFSLNMIIDLLCCFIIYTEVSFELTYLCIKPKLWSKCQLKKTLSCGSYCLSRLNLFLQKQQYKHSTEIKRVRKNDAHRLHRQPTSQQLSPKAWMTILRISTCEAVSEMTLNLSLQSQFNKALPDFSQALYTDSP